MGVRTAIVSIASKMSPHSSTANKGIGIISGRYHTNRTDINPYGAISGMAIANLTAHNS